MAISFFTGFMGGAILGYATQGRTRFCKYMLTNHPTLLKALGTAFTLFLILVPTLILSGAWKVDATPFFWGGCMTMSGIYSFMLVHCAKEEPDESQA